MDPPEWTEENEHDPGVTLVQLLAWLAAGLVAWRLVDRRRSWLRAAVRRVAGGAMDEDRFAPVRRLLVFVEESLDRGIRSAGFEPAGVPRWRTRRPWRRR